MTFTIAKHLPHHYYFPHIIGFPIISNCQHLDYLSSIICHHSKLYHDIHTAITLHLQHGLTVTYEHLPAVISSIHKCATVANLYINFVLEQKGVTIITIHGH